MNRNSKGQFGTDELFRFGAGVAAKEGSPSSLEAWFLDEKAENAGEFERLIVEAVRDQALWRRNFYPSDPTQITESSKRSSSACP